MLCCVRVLLGFSVGVIGFDCIWVAFVRMYVCHINCTIDSRDGERGVKLRRCSMPLTPTGGTHSERAFRFGAPIITSVSPRRVVDAFMRLLSFPFPVPVRKRSTSVRHVCCLINFGLGLGLPYMDYPCIVDFNLTFFLFCLFLCSVPRT